MVSLHRATLCAVYLLLSPQSTESIFFRALFCRLFRRGCKSSPVKPPTRAPIVKTPIAPAPAGPTPVITVPVAPVPVMTVPVAPAPPINILPAPVNVPAAAAPVINDPINKAPVAPTPVASAPINIPPTPVNVPAASAPVINAPINKAPVAPVAPVTADPPTKAPVKAPINSNPSSKAPSTKAPSRAPIKPPTRAPIATLPASDYNFVNSEDKACFFLEPANDTLTVCIRVNNRQLSTVVADHVAVFGIVPPNITVPANDSLCVKTTKNKLVDGPNSIQITAKDTLGNAFTVSDDIWMGLVNSAIRVVGNGDTYVYVTLVDDPEVTTQTFTYHGFNAPLNRLMFAAGYFFFGGESSVVPVFLSSVSSVVPNMILSPPSLVSGIANSDLSLGTTDGWSKVPLNADMSIVKHIEILPSKQRSLRQLLSIDYNINVCTSKSNPTVRMFRGVRVGAGVTTAEIRFRFSTNDVNNRHGYHVWLHAMNSDTVGHESFVAGSGAGLVRNGDPFNLVDGNLTSSKWMRHTLPIYSNTVFAEIMITVHSQPDSLQPDLRSCITVDYLSVY